MTCLAILCFEAIALRLKFEDLKLSTRRGNMHGYISLADRGGKSQAKKGAIVLLVSIVMVMIYPVDTVYSKSVPYALRGRLVRATVKLRVRPG